MTAFTLNDHKRAELVAGAQDVLRQNDRDGKYTVPSNKLYPYQWAWDSAFLAIGWATFNPSRGLTELETLFSGQWDDGRMPHIHFWQKVDSYFPGPDVWGCEKSSTITNPAVFALALHRVHELCQAVDDDDERQQLNARVKALLPKVEAFHLFLKVHRDPKGIGCVANAHPWESGRDNCIAWDAPMQNVDIEGVDASGRKDKDKVDDPKQRPTDEAYRGYLSLVYSIKDSDFGPGPFAVYDPFLTTLLAVGEFALSRLAVALDDDALAQRAQQRGEAVQAALLQHLWSDDDQHFVTLDAHTGKTESHHLLASLFPLLLKLPDDIRDVLMNELRDDFLTTTVKFPTVSPKHEQFDEVCYWRGPVWVNMTWFFWPIVPDEVKATVLGLVAEHGFCEYYNPHSADALGAPAFGWSAALTLDLLAR